MSHVPPSSSRRPQPPAGGRPARPLARVAAAWSALLLVLLAGCSQSAFGASAPRDPSLHAVLDRNSGEIVLPLSEYDFYDSESTMDLANHATDIALATCMTAAGSVYSAVSIEEIPESRIGDRTYGLWNEDQALLHGFGSAPSPVDAAIDADRAAGGEAWDAAYEDCATRPDAELTALLPDNGELTESLVPRLRTAAYNSASADPAWQAARESWWQCLREAGLDPRTGSGDWTSRQGVEVAEARSPAGGSASEEEIRVASTEARCNSETGLAQTLGDLEASYQAPLITANRAALDELKAENAERLAGLRDYLARRG